MIHSAARVIGMLGRWASRAIFFAALFALPSGQVRGASERGKGPNVVVIMADDQGYGDVGWHGNPVLATPNLDALAREGVELSRFYVSPVCAPTRASLLTGRYNYRTRVVDTFQGRAMMDPEEVTLAEHLSSAGYRCGIFGKWHLGDNYPMRPVDQGFHESLVHRGGGIGQPSDPPGGSSYFDPILTRNGALEKTKGYCSDVYTDAALRFIDANRERPFLLYLAFNAPPVPLVAPQGALEHYLKRDLASVTPPWGDPAVPRARELETTARVYAMIANIDENVGRLMERLKALGLDENTLVLFLTDNGPQQARYNAGLRGLKGGVFEGGIRVPCVWRWPGRLDRGKRIDLPAAHIDVVPTVLEACGVAVPAGAALDGRSVWSMLTGRAGRLPDRPYFVQWHRGDVPQSGRACAVVTERWKLLQPQGVPEGPFEPAAKWLLFDILDDPTEMRDLAAEQPERVQSLLRLYDAWFDDVSKTRGFDPPRIALGTTHENPTLLTRQDWRTEAPQTTALGHWEVSIAEGGLFELAVTIEPGPNAGTVRLAIGDVAKSRAVAARQTTARFENVRVGAGDARLSAWVEAPAPNSPKPARHGAWSVEVKRIAN